ncbi:MAG TPA: acyl carrier protein [Symbiobacteriaceae bacterium]|nr:acyl carrier protein [Symbiobacteriaceae bacterium]
MSYEQLLSLVLDVPAEVLTDEVGREELGAWTSFAHINLITTLEEAYGVTFTTDEINRVKTVGEVRRALQAKGVAV